MAVMNKSLVLDTTAFAPDAQAATDMHLVPANQVATVKMSYVENLDSVDRTYSVALDMGWDTVVLIIENRVAHPGVNHVVYDPITMSDGMRIKANGSVAGSLLKIWYCTCDGDQVFWN